MLNLASVTKTLINLIKAQFEVYQEPSGSIQVTGAPPGDGSAYGQLSVYLYHLVESPHLRNWSAGGAGPVPVQHTPLGLVLNYIVTAVHKADDPADSVESEQKWIGYVARTIHDYPVISPDLRIGSTPILDAGLGNNSIELVIRPAAPEETISFWGVGENNAPRLSLFLEARVAFLEPEPPETVMPGIVYTVGSTVTAGMGTHIQGTMSTQSFFPYQGLLQTVVSRPARVSAFAGVPSELAIPPQLLPRVPVRLGGKNPLLDNNLLAFECQTRPPTQLRLILESGGRYVDADLGASVNSGWQLKTLSTTATMRVAPVLVGRLARDPGVPDGNFWVIPDVYAASLSFPVGSLRQTTTRVPFTIVPQILAADPSLGSVTSFLVAGAFDRSLVRWEPELVIDGKPLELKVPSPGHPLTNGQFSADADPVAGTTTIRFVNPVGMSPGVKLVQFLVNHIAAGPLWLEVT